MRPVRRWSSATNWCLRRCWIRFRLSAGCSCTGAPCRRCVQRSATTWHAWPTMPRPRRMAKRCSNSNHAPHARPQRCAHREAARHYRTALLRAGNVDDEDRQRWLGAHAAQCLNVDWHDKAITARQQLDKSYRHIGDATGEARNLSRLTLLYVFRVSNAQARCGEPMGYRTARNASARSRAGGRLRPSKRRCACSTATAPTVPQGAARRLR